MLSYTQADGSVALCQPWNIWDCLKHIAVVTAAMPNTSYLLALLGAMTGGFSYCGIFF